MIHAFAEKEERKPEKIHSICTKEKSAETDRISVLFVCKLCSCNFQAFCPKEFVYGQAFSGDCIR